MISDERKAPAYSIYELPLSGDGPAAEPSPAEIDAAEAHRLLLDNLAWYCQLRWAVAGILLLFGLSGFVPGLMAFFGLKGGLLWPFVLSPVLATANALFLAHMRLLKRSGNRPWTRRNLWAQIIFDLFIVTITVNRVGSLETFIAFFYLFHIVLSCIFLSRPESFLVAVVSLALFALCLGMETLGLLPRSAIYLEDGLREAMRINAAFPWVPLMFVCAIFLVVWFLASRLSSLLRHREQDLLETNERLLHSQKERMRFMLQTTHELKAPFAAIQANTQLLLKGYCGEMKPDAASVVRQIDERSHRLTGMIQEMLQLANLRSQSEGPLRFVELDLAAVLKSSIQQVRQIAEEHRISLKEDVLPAQGFGVEEHLKVLFINLIKNAIQYSHPGGAVEIRCAPLPEKGGVRISVRDQGIGIPADKLPKIFNEYFRTNEALQHNKDSTGLGLAIVRHIAETHRIGLQVESAQNAGTAFHLFFPAGMLSTTEKG
jgi:signal transduction histidine kinase